MSEHIQSAILALRALYLPDYPYAMARQIIGTLGKSATIRYTFRVGESFLRARPNFSDETFSSIDDLKYKPAHLNTQFQRASTPKNTMFYACYLPNSVKEGDLNEPKLVGAMETLKWLRDTNTSGLKKISFGKWIVKKEFKVIAILQHGKYYNESSFTKELVDSFNIDLQKYPEHEEKSRMISSFLATEFAKEETKFDYDYIISAAATVAIIESGLGGVLYPSVRIGGKGFNVAIQPKIVDDYLELAAVTECLIYKHKGKVCIDNLTFTNVTPESSCFELRPVEPKYHAGENYCLRAIGVNSIAELLSFH